MYSAVRVVLQIFIVNDRKRGIFGIMHDIVIVNNDSATRTTVVPMVE